MSKYKVAVIEGDGIGPEVVRATLDVLESTDLDFEWDMVDLNARIMEHHPNTLPKELLDRLRQAGRVLKGPISTPAGAGFLSPNVLLRQKLGLFASVRPVNALFKNGALRPQTDILIVRETTEDLYVMKETLKNGVASAEKLITQKASSRVAHKAFNLCVAANRKKVTALHKADILKQTDGLFLKACRDVAKAYPAIEYTEATIDSACTQLILNPSQFDVVVAPNMYGDIFSDVAAGLVGGLGLLGSANVGNGPSVYEAVHGSAPDIAGKNMANPSGMILAAVMMLQDLGELKIAEALQASIEEVLNSELALTPDLGGNATTKTFTRVLIDAAAKRLGSTSP